MNYKAAAIGFGVTALVLVLFIVVMGLLIGLTPASLAFCTTNVCPSPPNVKGTTSVAAGKSTTLTADESVTWSVTPNTVAQILSESAPYSTTTEVKGVAKGVATVVATSGDGISTKTQLSVN